MNLELLDPFRRQVPDRVDSTLSLPESLVPQTDNNNNNNNNKSKSSNDNKAPPKPPAPIAAQHLAFNRRGNYVAVGYANGMIAVYDVLSRTVSSVYRMTIPAGEMSDHHGSTSLSWSRRSRTLLVGSLASPRVMLIDTTHPQGPKECGAASNIHVPIPKSSNKKESSKNNKKKSINNDDEDEDDEERMSPAMGATTASKEGLMMNQASSSFATATRVQLDQQLTAPRHVPVHRVYAQHVEGPWATSSTRRSGLEPLVQAMQKSSSSLSSSETIRRYPSITFDLPYAVGATLQVHPRDPLTGQAVLQDGSLVVFDVPSAAFEEKGEPTVLVSTVFIEKEYFVTCSCLDPHGEKLYAGTQDGKLLGFDVKELWDRLSSVDNDSPVIPSLQPSFVVSIPGGAAVWNMVVSRNGKSIVLNSADAALRLYSTVECWTTPEEVEKPQFVFQDVVNKVKFASCDISGDGEYVAGGAQRNDTKYEVYIWNTSTGVLAEKLTGSPVDLYSVAWQPTRSFLAVAASDGLVDVWGPRINWTAFAPDFQALPHNVEYVEREDEFDEVVTSETAFEGKEGKEDEEEKAHVDILTLHKIPVFQSDSEDEEDVFHFDVVRRPTVGTSL